MKIQSDASPSWWFGFWWIGGEYVRVVEHAPSQIHCQHRCYGDEMNENRLFPMEKSTGIASPIILIAFLASIVVWKDERLCPNVPMGVLTVWCHCNHTRSTCGCMLHRVLEHQMLSNSTSVFCKSCRSWNVFVSIDLHTRFRPRCLPCRVEFQTVKCRVRKALWSSQWSGMISEAMMTIWATLKGGGQCFGRLSTFFERSDFVRGCLIISGQNLTISGQRLIISGQEI